MAGILLRFILNMAKYFPTQNLLLLTCKYNLTEHFKILSHEWHKVSVLINMKKFLTILQQHQFCQKLILFLMICYFDGFYYYIYIAGFKRMMVIQIQIIYANPDHFLYLKGCERVSILCFQMSNQNFKTVPLPLIDIQIKLQKPVCGKLVLP